MDDRCTESACQTCKTLHLEEPLGHHSCYTLDFFVHIPSILSPYLLSLALFFCFFPIICFLFHLRPFMHLLLLASSSEMLSSYPSHNLFLFLFLLLLLPIFLVSHVLLSPPLSSFFFLTPKLLSAEYGCWLCLLEFISEKPFFWCVIANAVFLYIMLQTVLLALHLAVAFPLSFVLY